MSRVRIAVALLSSVVTPSFAGAQTCHGAEPVSPGKREFSLALRQDTASFRTERYEGHYQGLFASAKLELGNFAAGVSLPYYRLLKNGLVERGAGDLALRTQVSLIGSGGGVSQAGLDLAATLPTGDPDADLGMGHVMFMPGIWARTELEPVTLSARLAYGIALADSDAHEHHSGGAAPLVDPMNRSELEPALFAALALSDVVLLRAGGSAGLPVGIDDGEARASVFFGVSLTAGAIGARLEGHLPIAGDPFDEKLAVELSVRF